MCGRFQLGQMWVAMPYLRTTLGPFLLTRTYFHSCRPGMSRSDAKNACVCTIQTQQQHSTACLLATWYLSLTPALRTIALNLLFVLMVLAKRLCPRNQEIRLTSLLLIAGLLVRDLKLTLSFCLMNTRSMRNKSADIFLTLFGNVK